MNANDVERRLETLAAGSAEPEVPAALFARLAQLESGSVATEPLRRTSQVLHFRRGRGSRIRGITVIGLAATLVLAGGALYVAGNHNLQTTTSPSPLGTQVAPTRQTPTTTSAAPTANPSLPVALGSWTQVASLGPSLNGYQPYSTSWQDGQFIGRASGLDELSRRVDCALHSSDGRNWTCSPLVPDGVQCIVDTCFGLDAIAFSNGHFVAVDSILRSQTTGDGMLSGLITTFVWTSVDGVHWQRQPDAPFTGDYELTNLLPTALGFVLTLQRSEVGPVIWTSTDGASWQQAAFASGSAPMATAYVVGNPTIGYMAEGRCIVRSVPLVCSAHSSDGRTWSIGYPLAAAATDLARRLQSSFSGVGWKSGTGWIAYAGGRWTIHFTTTDVDRTVLSDTGEYEASSVDGAKWVLERAPDDMLVPYSRPMLGQPSGTSMWTIDGPQPPARLYTRTSVSDVPNWTPSIYWSTLGVYWVRIGASPPGYCLAIVETPTEVMAVMADLPTLTIWAATKK